MPPDNRWLAVSVHDVAPATWERCERILASIREVADIPVTLLVVPAYHGECSARPAFERELTRRLAEGHELALHGYFHCDPQSPCGVADWLLRRVYTVEGEFSSLCEREATERIHLGQRWFAANGWPLSGFVAPAWLMSPGAWSAVRTNRDLLYTSTLTKIHLLQSVTSVPAPCLTYSTRTAWRRLGSLLWTRMLSATAAMPLVRIGLHPGDADDATVRRSWQRCLGRLLEDRTAVTKAGFVRAWSDARQGAIRPEHRAPAPVLRV